MCTDLRRIKYVLSNQKTTEQENHIEIRNTVKMYFHVLFIKLNDNLIEQFLLCIFVTIYYNFFTLMFIYGVISSSRDIFGSAINYLFGISFLRKTKVSQWSFS